MPYFKTLFKCDQPIGLNTECAVYAPVFQKGSTYFISLLLNDNAGKYVAEVNQEAEERFAHLPMCEFRDSLEQERVLTAKIDSRGGHLKVELNGDRIVRAY